MAPKKVKQARTWEEGSSSNLKRRGRKPESEKRMYMVNTYMAGNSSEILEQINGWEWELRSISENKEIPQGEWEDLVLDPRNTRSRNSLFNKSLQ